MFHIETEPEAEGRWIAEVVEIPGVVVYAPSRDLAIRKAQALALRVLADRVERGTEELVLNQLFSIVG